MSGSSRPLRPADVARAAGVTEAFVMRVLEAGGLTTDREEGGLTEDDVTRVRLLAMWDSAGLSVEAIVAAASRGDLSFAFLGNPTMALGQRLDVTYEELCRREGVDLALVQQLHEALGFAAPAADEAARNEDPLMIWLLEEFSRMGTGREPVLRLLRVYADALRRIAQAEVEFYESEIEGPMRRDGASEVELLDRGSETGNRLTDAIEQTLLAIYRRRRQHVWLDHSVGHAEPILEQAGVYHRREDPPCVCFVDLTGYTRLTEELGDAAAADMAGRLSALVSGISQRHDGRPVRWLGDGGMFVFRDAPAAVLAAEEIVRETPGGGLPPTHIGIHCGPLIFQDGDIYGGTVNIAARLSARAEAGEILVSAAVAHRVPEASFEPLGSVALKGVLHRMAVFRLSPPPTGSAYPSRAQRD